MTIAAPPARGRPPADPASPPAARWRQLFRKPPQPTQVRPDTRAFVVEGWVSDEVVDEPGRELNREHLDDLRVLRTNVQDLHAVLGAVGRGQATIAMYERYITQAKAEINAAFAKLSRQ